MPNFGNYGLIGNTRHTFEKDPHWWWDIQPINAGMELDNSKFLVHHRLVADNSGRSELPPTTMEVMFNEIALCFGGTNIPADESKPVDEGGEPIIKLDESLDQIKAKLRIFPREMLVEIWRAVGQAYPKWGPADPNWT